MQNCRIVLNNTGKQNKWECATNLKTQACQKVFSIQIKKKKRNKKKKKRKKRNSNFIVAKQR